MTFVDPRHREIIKAIINIIPDDFPVAQALLVLEDASVPLSLGLGFKLDMAKIKSLNAMAIDSFGK